MLHHPTEDAIAILMYVVHPYTENDDILGMALTSIRSMRDVGYNQDIVVITNEFDFERDGLTCEEYRNALLAEGVIIEYREPFDWPANDNHPVAFFDMQKLQYWSLDRYRKVLAVDCDTIAIRQFTSWDHQNLLVVPQLFDAENNRWVNGDINSGIMLISPSRDIYEDMMQIVQTATFDRKNGWNNCRDTRRIHHWDFYCANAVQGFVPYYFHGQMQLQDFRPYFRHFPGAQKEEEEYRAIIKRVTPNRPLSP